MGPRESAMRASGAWRAGEADDHPDRDHHDGRREGSSATASARRRSPCPRSDWASRRMLFDDCCRIEAHGVQETRQPQQRQPQEHGSGVPPRKTVYKRRGWHRGARAFGRHPAAGGYITEPSWPIRGTFGDKHALQASRAGRPRAAAVPAQPDMRGKPTSPRRICAAVERCRHSKATSMTRPWQARGGPRAQGRSG